MGWTNQNRSGRHRRSAQLLALEPRMMFDAAAVVTAQQLAPGDPATAAATDPGDHGPAAHAAASPHLDGATDRSAPVEVAAHTVHPDAIAARMVDEHDTRSIDDGGSAHEAADTGTGRQIIFIDTSVADYRQLADAWADRGTVVLIDGSHDGLDQVRSALAGQADVGAIHIVSHGDEGVLWLGTTRIDRTAIEGELAATLGAIGRSLRPGGDILLYGCDFAEGSDGAAALQAFAQATHADVAASTDLTGAERLGGDWTLEAHDGTVETRALDARAWDHTLDPNAPVPIAVQPDSLTVTYNGSTVVSGSTGYTTTNGVDRGPDVGVGAVARWTGAATYQGQSLDLVARVVSLSSGDAVRFNRPTGATNGDDPTFLLRDVNTDGAQVRIEWSLVKSGTDTPVAADVEFGILDIDGIGGQPLTRESVSASTAGLSYFSREKNSDIYFQSSLDQITASGTQNENTDTSKPLSTASEATFDWKNVSTWTLTYSLAKNSVTSQAQFYQDGNFDFHYTDPVYTSIPRLDLDADDSTAPGNDAHFTYTGNGPASAIVDGDVRVSNPMDVNSVTGGTVRLTNAKPGDQLLVGALPSGITATTATGGDGSITVTLTGAGSETAYDQAFRAITFANANHAPDATQRVIEVSFHNDTLTSATATSRIDVVPVNAAPVRQGSLPDRAAQDAAAVSYATASGFSDPDGDTLSYAAAGLPAGLSIDPATGVISGTLDRSASQANGGRYTVTVTATDPSRASTTQGFTLSVTNPAPVARNDTASTDEDTVTTIAVLANDSDPDGDPLTVIAASAQHGSVTRNPDGTVTYTPDSHYHGSDTLTYTISDGQGGTSTATVAVTVVHVNHAPTANGSLPATYAAQDGQAIDTSVASSFSDPDGDPLAYAASGLPAGLTIDPATGRITGTIDRSASQVNGGSYPITLTATDPSGASVSRTVTLTVTNPPPTANDDRASTDENVPVTIAVLANDTDPDGDPLTVTAASAQHGSVARNPDGTITYTPTTYFHGTDTITYWISDGQGGTSSATVAVTVAHVNQAPQRAGSLTDQASQDAARVSYATAQAFGDPDGDALRYAASGLPAGLTIDPATGVISGALGRSASQANGGVYAITVTATDPAGLSGSQSFRLVVADPAPVAVDDPAIRLHPGEGRTVTVLANDSDPDGDPLSVVAASAAHGGVVINPDGTIRYTADTGYAGADTIRYTISDGEGGTASAVVPVTIGNQAPTADPLASQTVSDAQTISVSVAGAFRDGDGDPLTYSATGLPAGLTIDPATGVISGTIDRSASQANGGRYASRITADDGHGGSVTAPLDWTIANPPPVAQDDAATTAEDTPVTLAVLANDGDPDGDPLTVTAASAGHGTVAINPDGTLTYTPATDYNGADTIHYTISDGQGGTASASVAVTVTPVNDAPQAVGTLPARSATDGAAVSLPTASGFTDPDGDALAYTAVGLPAGLTIDPATGVIAGTIDRSASQVNGGRYAVSVTATDPSEARTTQGFILTVANPPPVARDDAATTAEDAAVTIAVLANDSDPDGDPLTVTSASAGHGTVAINPDNTLGYTPAAGFHRTDTIRYTIGDGQGGASTATVTVTVAHVNHAPVAIATELSIAARDGQRVDVSVAPLFTDADGDGLTYAATGLPAGLTLDPASGRVTGTIDRSASEVNGGAYRITVTATDPSGASVGKPVTLTVTNPPPVASDDAATTAEDTAVTVAVLANDSDPDSDPLTVTSASAGHGTVAINPDGTLTYTPATDYNGADTIRYTISDGQGGTDTASVAVTVTPVNDAPQAVGTLPARSATDGGAVSLPTAPAFSDPDGDPLTYAATGLPAGLTIDPATGVIAGMLAPDASVHGPYTVTITATDPSGAGTSRSFPLDVAHPDPIATGEQVTTAQEQPVTIAVLANDRSPSGARLSVTGVAAQHGSVAIGPDGTLIYTPADGYRGTDTIRYTIGDDAGGKAAAEVAVTITPVDHAPTATASIPAERGSDGGTVALDLGGYFADRDGDPLTYAATGLPAGLSIDARTGVITGTLARDASAAGPYHIVVTATDPAGQSVASAFDWAIVHPRPTPRDDAAATASAVPVAIAVLANDTDPLGEPLSVTAAGAAHGSVTVEPDGTLRYTSAPGFAGQDVVTYTVRDSGGGIASASVLVTVTPPPVATNGVAATAPDQAVSLPVLTLASDPAGLPLAVTAVGADHGTATIQPDGTVRYQPGAGFAGLDTVRYTVTDGHGGSATALVAITVADPERPPVVPGRAPVEAIGGQPLPLDLLAGVVDPDGDPVTLQSASAAVGTLTVAPDGRAVFTAPLGFAGTTTLTYTVSDGRGGETTATLVIRVADGRGADINQLLRIGQVRFVDPTPPLARIALGPDGEGRSPLTLLRTIEAIRPLHPTVLGDHPVDDAVNAARWLRGTDIDPAAPIAAEVARLDALADRRDEAGRLIDPRWGDFLVKGLTGFSAASDTRAGIMVDSVVRGDALYLEVRDTAAGRLAPVRSVDVRLARGDRPDWIRVDRRGLAIVERAADRDELHLVIRVTRADGRHSDTRVTVQGATGEIELDHAALRHRAVPPLDATLAHPKAIHAAEADRLARNFE